MSPNEMTAEGVGQDAPTKEINKAYDDKHGTYDEAQAKSAKPTTASPGVLPNTPSPFTLGGT